MTDKTSPLEKMRVPFAANHISKLPKPTKAQTEAVRADFKKGIRCTVCGAWHHPDVVHLDYVGHAALTDRLLDTDLAWTWEPLAIGDDGLPALDRNGGLWIRLTIAGVTRLGYGSADGKSGGDAIKEIIGDALRNAGMRFGAALDLWHKGDLHADDADDAPVNATQQPVAGSAGSQPSPAPVKRTIVKLDGPYTSKTALWDAVKGLDREIRGCGDIDQLDALIATDEAKAIMTQCERDAPSLLNGGEGLPEEFLPLRKLIDMYRGELIEQANVSGRNFTNAG